MVERDSRLKKGRNEKAQNEGGGQRPFIQEVLLQRQEGAARPGKGGGCFFLEKKKRKAKNES